MGELIDLVSKYVAAAAEVGYAPAKEWKKDYSFADNALIRQKAEEIYEPSAIQQNY